MWIILGVCVVLTAFNAEFAKAQADTARVSPVFPPQEISAQGPLNYRRDAFRFQLNADSLGVVPSAGVSIGALLQQTPGVYLREYGGTGDVQTASARGFAADQTALAINGVPYESRQNGVANLGNFFSPGVGQVTFENGGRGLAQNPAGGVLGLGYIPERQKTYARLGAGSFGLTTAQAGYARPAAEKKFGFYADLFLTAARNDFSFDWNETSGARPDSRYRYGRIIAGIEKKILERAKISYFILTFADGRNVPSPVVKGATGFSQERLFQQNVFHYLQYHYTPKKTLASITFTLKHQYDFIEYYFTSLRYTYTNHHYLFQGETKFSIKKIAFTLNLQSEYARLTGNNLAIGLTPIDKADRLQANAALSGARTFRLRALKAETNAVLRTNAVSGFNPALNFSVGQTFGLASERLQAFFRATGGVRFPNFNELYYFGYGNAALRPEKSRTLEVGLLGRWALLKRLTFAPRGSLFWNRTVDKIISVPISPVRWSTQTLGLTQTVGFEIGGEAVLAKYGRAYLYYTYQTAEDRSLTAGRFLPLTPAELLNAGGEAAFGPFILCVNLFYSGWRYATLQNLPDEVLGAYFTADVALRYRQPLCKGKAGILDVNLSLRNAGDARYATTPGYPAVGRSFFIETGWTFLPVKNVK